jgi:putative ATPase
MKTEPTLFSDSAPEPLASRLRPRSLEEFVGQQHLLGEGKPLRLAIERGEVPSIVFWGPPGSGKTTLALLIAQYTNRHFEPFSAVTEGVPRVREIIKEAQGRRDKEGRGTILFCDEIHRFNKAQQDAFLPWVEQGVITLIGATTENPSFELTGALLSRMQVYVLEPLSEGELETIVRRAFAAVGPPGGENRRVKREEGAHTRLSEGGENRKVKSEGSAEAWLSADALGRLVRYADGDARRALNAIEAIAAHVRSDPSLFTFPFSLDLLESVLSRRLPRYDKGGEEHFNLISAVHKAVRGSDVEGALYWLARMLEGGEDPLYIARRVVRMAAEDVGLADPRALSVALAAKEAYHFLGSPEGELAIAEAVIYLATAPKSNRVYEAWGKAVTAAREHPAEPVPLHIRNAPTRLMKELGYGNGYRYDPHEAEGLAAGQEYLPEVLRGARWYEPTDGGFEKTVRERLAWWAELRERVRGHGPE